MRVVKFCLMALLALGFQTMAGVAYDYDDEDEYSGPPSDYEEQAFDYVTSRLDDPNAAQVRFTSSPYRVRADLYGYEDLEGWAVDLRVKARLYGGRSGGFVPYTVIFVEGDAVALRSDVRRLTRL